VKPAIFIPNPHVRMDRPWGTPYVPLELLSVMAVAEQAGVTSKLFDVNQLLEEGRLQVEPGIWQRAAELAAQEDPALVVMETWTGTLHHTVLLLRALRPLLPTLPVIFLGAGTSALAEEMLTSAPELDGVIRGEGEPAMAVLARGLSGTGFTTPLNRRLPKAPGLVRRTIHGIESAELAFVEDLDALPRPAFHRSFLRPGDSISLESGRGCEIGCSFCALAGHWSRRYRPRLPERLAEEMLDMASRYPGSTLDLTQDVRFFTDPDRVMRLCRHLTAQPNRPRWSCHARIDAIGADELAAMAEAGCRGILFGVETGCQAMQARIGKNVNLSRLMPTLALAKRFGIETRATFMVGFPEEDASSLGKTARAILDARRAGAADTSVQVLRTPLGSRLFEAFSDKLAFEPLLGVASAGDSEARSLIASNPRLYSASYWVPTRVVSRPALLAANQGSHDNALPRERVLGAWLALALLVEPMAALGRHGADLDALLAELAIDGQAEDLDLAAEEVAKQIENHAKKACFIDPITLEDMLAYHLAIGAVSRKGESEPSPVDASTLALLRSQPERIFPSAKSPWKLLKLWTPLSRLLEGNLAPGPHPKAIRLVVAKIGAAGEASYYTRRSSSIETFTVDETAALVLPLCDSRHSLSAIAGMIAAQTDQSSRKVLPMCIAIVYALLQGGVLGFVTQTPDEKLSAPG
jgi:hypothetical protein